MFAATLRIVWSLALGVVFQTLALCLALTFVVGVVGKSPNPEYVLMPSILVLSLLAGWMIHRNTIAIHGLNAILSSILMVGAFTWFAFQTQDVDARIALWGLALLILAPLFSLAGVALAGRRSTPATTSIVVDDDGFTITSDQTKRVDWNSVTAIVTYKVDCFAWDLIYLAFATESHESMIHTHEQDDGWRAFLPALKEHFDVPENWMVEVAMPPFEENMTLLWKRDG